ncbi:MAG: Uma2 family endonuclease [Planctomycetes bacterium]|nr:Uma2 family endonuclease [Planctomycetota bacterium]
MPSPNVTTADQLLALRDPPWRHELWRGELRRMSPAGHHHGGLAARTLVRIATFVERHRLGAVYTAETGFVLARDPDTVLAPDVAFVRTDRLPPKGSPGFFPGAPDLAVEVLSPDDTRRKVTTKVAAWLEHGTREVWLVDPKRRTLTVHTANAAPHTLAHDATLQDSAVLPGFTLALADLFDD